MSTDRIFEQVVANPEDPETLLVYADVLSERGDDLGELIVLQVRGENTEREATLREQIEREIMGDAWERTDPDAFGEYEFKWHLGLVRRARFEDKAHGLDHPAMGCLTRLDLVLSEDDWAEDFPTAELPLLEHLYLDLEMVEDIGARDFETIYRAFPSVKRLTLLTLIENPSLGDLGLLDDLVAFELGADAIGEAALAQVFAANWPHLERLVLQTLEDDVEVITPLLDGQLHPKLHELGLFGFMDNGGGFDRISQSPLASRLTAMGLDFEDPDVDELLERNRPLFDNIKFFDAPENELEPDPDALYERASSMWRTLDRNDEAIELLERAIELDPDDGGYLLELAELLEDSERHDEALEALELARLIESDADVDYLQTRILANSERFDEARIKALNLVEESESTESWQLLAEVEAADGNQTAALAAYDKGYELDPEDLSSLTEKAELLDKLWRFEEAAEIYARLIELTNGEDPDYFREKALCEMALARVGDARATIVAGRAKTPAAVELTELDARFDIALLSSERLGPALSTLEQCLDAPIYERDDDGVGFSYAYGLVRAGDPEAAIRVVAERQTAPADADVAYALALAHAALRDPDAAKRALAPHESNINCPLATANHRLIMALASSADRENVLGPLAADVARPADVIAAIISAEPDRKWHTLDAARYGNVRNDLICCSALAAIGKTLLGRQDQAQAHLAALREHITSELGPPYTPSNLELRTILDLAPRIAAETTDVAQALVALLFE